MTIQKASKDFKPHVALTGINMNGGAANEHNVSCIQKANLTINDELSLLKRLGKATPEAVEKASYRNLQKQLEAALHERTKPIGCDYHWVWIQDFDESTVIFESGDKSYSIGFAVSEMGIVELKDEDYVEVVRQDVYVKTDGSELILKGAEESEGNTVEGEEADTEVQNEEVESPDDIVDSEVQEGEEVGVKSTGEPSDIDNENNEDVMSKDKVELTEEQKIDLAIEKARAGWEKEAKDAKALEDAQGVVKGFGIAEESVELIAKAFVADEALGQAIQKGFEAKDAKIAEVQAEMEVIKGKFGDEDQVSDDSTPAEVEKGLTPAEQMKANMQADLAAKSK
ncbi:hypothetical protein VPHK354_0015 [Vibrio phage K354]